MVNGYMSVQLGSINRFASQIDWNSDTLWLSMNIGNTNVSCTPFTNCAPDGEMVPMKRLSSVAYAMNATMLNGKTADNFIQNQNSAVQVAANIWIDGTTRADTAVLSPTLDAADATTLNIGATNAVNVSIGKPAGSISLRASTTTVGTSGSAATIMGATQTVANTTGDTLTIKGSTGNGAGAGGQL